MPGGKRTRTPPTNIPELIHNDIGSPAGLMLQALQSLIRAEPNQKNATESNPSQQSRTFPRTHAHHSTAEPQRPTVITVQTPPTNPTAQQTPTQGPSSSSRQEKIRTQAREQMEPTQPNPITTQWTLSDQEPGEDELPQIEETTIRPREHRGRKRKNKTTSKAGRRKRGPFTRAQPRHATDGIWSVVFLRIHS